MLEDLLNLTGSSVSVIRESKSSDGMGGFTTLTTITGIPKAAMWSPSQSKSYISEKMALLSTHILVTIPSYYTFNINDSKVTFNSDTYKITGFDDVMNMGEIMVVGLEKIK